ncbi:hypothetical protein AB4212_10200, partial [Streptomyces sp. 2MCAF27]
MAIRTTKRLTATLSLVDSSLAPRSKGSRVTFGSTGPSPTTGPGTGALPRATNVADGHARPVLRP